MSSDVRWIEGRAIRDPAVSCGDASSPEGAIRPWGPPRCGGGDLLKNLLDQVSQLPSIELMISSGQHLDVPKVWMCPPSFLIGVFRRRYDLPGLFLLDGLGDVMGLCGDPAKRAVVEDVI